MARVTDRPILMGPAGPPDIGSGVARAKVLQRNEQTNEQAMMSERSNGELPNFSAGVDGLLPAVAQDHATGRVLMMAWMNREAWDETLRSGQACYFSRSRGQLWRKGETSGHRQRVIRLQVDCDADCILMQVEQIGAACHEGYASCFFRTVHPDLSITIEEARLVDPERVYGPLGKS